MYYIRHAVPLPSRMPRVVCFSVTDLVITVAANIMITQQDRRKHGTPQFKSVYTQTAVYNYLLQKILIGSASCVLVEFRKKTVMSVGYTSHPLEQSLYPVE